MKRPSKTLCAVAFTLVGCFLFLGPIRRLLIFSLGSGLYSYIPLVPVISGCMIFARRQQLEQCSGSSMGTGLFLAIVSSALLVLGLIVGHRLSGYDSVVLSSFAAVLWCWAGCMFFGGLKAFRHASFPLFFLLFAVPVPELVLDAIIALLQTGSAEMTALIFTLLNVPFAREGFLFQVAGVSVEVARECSGIRSSLVLFMVSLLAGEVVLKRARSKILLAVLAVPVAVFKNALRIAALVLIAVYVDKRILLGALHTRGGVLFFVFALLVMAPILLFLKRKDGCRALPARD